MLRPWVGPKPPLAHWAYHHPLVHHAMVSTMYTTAQVHQSRPRLRQASHMS